MANIGDKYIIEIREEIGKGLYRLKNSADDLVVIPALTVEGFEKYDPEADYQRGLDDAWETARKISKMSNKEQFDCFDNHGMTNVLDYNTAAKAIETLRAYEAEKKAEEEIKVGDEVETDYNGNVIIAEKPKDGWYVTIAKNFARYSIHESHIIKKTGRHFPQVAELLDAMIEDGDTNEEP